jgi:hypothetical protein
MWCDRLHGLAPWLDHSCLCAHPRARWNRVIRFDSAPADAPVPPRSHSSLSSLPSRPPPHFLSFPHPTRHAPLHPAAEEGRSAGFRPLPRRGALLTLAPREAVGADVGHCPLPDRALCAPQCSNVRRYGCIPSSSARYNLKLGLQRRLFFFKSPAEGSPFS